MTKPRTEDWEKISDNRKREFLDALERADFNSLGGTIEYSLLEDDEGQTGGVEFGDSEFQGATEDRHEAGKASQEDGSL